jgi:hypothetical protein
MSKMKFHYHKVSAALPDEEVTKIVSEQLPRWKAACDNAEADGVILSQKAFGESLDETLLLAFAIKYAAIAKKNVTIVP